MANNTTNSTSAKKASRTINRIIVIIDNDLSQEGYSLIPNRNVYCFFQAGVGWFDQLALFNALVDKKRFS